MGDEKNSELFVQGNNPRDKACKLIRPNAVLQVEFKLKSKCLFRKDCRNIQCAILYDWNGKAVYGAEFSGGGNGMTNAYCPFLVKVSIDDLNIRKGAGTNTAKTGAYTGKGVFTIMEVREGKGSDKGWGRLQSGAGWIALSFCERV